MTGTPPQDKPRYLTEHLVDLRKALLRSLVFIAVGIGLAFWRSDWLFLVLLKPFQDTLDKFQEFHAQVHALQTLAPIEAFMIDMKLSTVVGLLLASPLVLRELW